MRGGLLPKKLEISGVGQRSNSSPTKSRFQIPASEVDSPPPFVQNNFRTAPPQRSPASRINRRVAVQVLNPLAHVQPASPNLNFVANIIATRQSRKSSPPTQQHSIPLRYPLQNPPRSPTDKLSSALHVKSLEPRSLYSLETSSRDPATFSNRSSLRSSRGRAQMRMCLTEDTLQSLCAAILSDVSDDRFISSRFVRQCHFLERHFSMRPSDAFACCVALPDDTENVKELSALRRRTLDKATTLTLKGYATSSHASKDSLSRKSLRHLLGSLRVVVCNASQCDPVSCSALMTVLPFSGARLTKLNFSGNVFITDDWARSAFGTDESHVRSRYPNLRFVNLSHTHVSTAVLPPLVHACGLGDDDDEFGFHLNGIVLLDSDIPTLFGPLLHTNRKLVTLSLLGSALQDGGLFVTILESTRQLEHIQLFSIECCSAFTPDDTARLMNQLKDCRHFECSSGIIECISVQQLSPTLQTLIVADCGIDDVGIAHFIRLCNCCSLRTLVLDGNPNITNAALSLILHNLPQLDTLSLNETGCTLPVICHVFSDHTTLRELHAFGCAPYATAIQDNISFMEEQYLHMKSGCPALVLPSRARLPSSYARPQSRAESPSVAVGYSPSPLMANPSGHASLPNTRRVMERPLIQGKRIHQSSRPGTSPFSSSLRGIHTQREPS